MPADPTPITASASASVEVWLPLLHETLAREGRFRWRLRGLSMGPTLPVDCEIEIVPWGEAVRLGDLIVFAAGDTLVAHRLVRRAGGRWITQGDGRLGPDAAQDPARALGIVVAAYRDGERCWPRSGQRLLAAFWVARHWMLRPVRAAWRRLRRR